MKKPAWSGRDGDITSGRGFTLVEMVVALTIVAILLTLAFPAMKQMGEEDEATHVAALLDMSRSLRGRALTENRPYQLVFQQGTLYGLRYFYPYNEENGFADFLSKQEEARQRRREEIQQMEVERQQVSRPGEAEEDALAPLPDADEEYFIKQVALDKEVKVEVLPWGALEWLTLEMGEIYRWVFQPSGFCDPLRVRFGEEGQWHELSFEVLTGELHTQRFYAQ